MKKQSIFVLLVSFLAVLAMAFEPISEDEKSLFRFDLKKNFYFNDEKFIEDINKGKEIVKKIEEHKGKVGSSSDELLELYNLINQLTNLYYKVYAYSEFREAINTKDRTPMEKFLEFSSDSDSRLSFIKVELKNLEESRFRQYLKEKPDLIKYKFFIEDTIRKAPFYLSQEKEEILSKVAPSRYEWESVLFQLAFDRTSFGSVEDDGKKFEVSQNFDALMKSKNRKVREESFKKYFEGLKGISDLCGFALYNLIKSLNEEAKMRGFKTKYDESLFDSYLDRSELENIFKQIEENASIYKDYQKFKLQNASRVEGIDTPKIWDYELTLLGAKDIRLTASDSIDLIIKALSPLGDKYVNELKELLDPKNGRLDIVGGPNRKQGAFCEAGFGFFQDNFQGYLSDISTLAHESGHAIHHRLVLLNKNGDMFSQGPPYLTESFAMFNEYLLRDYLINTLHDEALKKSVIYDFLNEEMYLFELCRRAKFEMLCYDLVESQEIKDAEGFNKVCEEVGKKIDIFFENYPELKYLWLRKHHYVTVPTYYKNYVVAQILAMNYFAKYKKEKGTFLKKYVSMVENGMDRDPKTLLKDFLAIDLNDPNLLKDTLKIVKEHFDELKKM